MQTRPQEGAEVRFHPVLVRGLLLTAEVGTGAKKFCFRRTNLKRERSETFAWYFFRCAGLNNRNYGKSIYTDKGSGPILPRIHGPQLVLCGPANTYS